MNIFQIVYLITTVLMLSLLPSSAMPSTEIHLRKQNISKIVLFSGGSDGYHSFRIPSLITTTTGTLLAFAEGRRFNNKDYGDINIVYKRSTDNGKTWSDLKVVEGIGPGTWGNPTSVVDHLSGRISIFMNWNSSSKNQFGNDGLSKIDQYGDRKTLHSYSDDDGITWSKPSNLTSLLTPTNYTWDAVGPGVGIQKNRSPNKGRIIIPATGRNFYSDDGGISWNYQLVDRNKFPYSNTGESTIVEDNKGSLIRNDRPVLSNWKIFKRRWQSKSDNGYNWTEFQPHNQLLDPGSQASIIKYNSNTPSRIIFLNPSSTNSRSKMRVRISYDNGVSWPIHRLLPTSDDDTKQLGGYSSIAKTNDYHIAALVESNNDKNNSDTSNRSIVLYKFNLPWIINGIPEPKN